MNKKYLLLPCLTALCTISYSQNKKPNVIIIYADDVGYGDLSCNGFSSVRTPNVERLASMGVRLTNAHTTSSTSTPSRYGLLTGEYPWRKEGTGVAPGDAAMVITPDQYTLADAFSDAGYTTAAIGKWHLGLGSKRGEQDWNGEITPGLKDIGFDYSFIMAATGDRVPCVYIENSRVVNLDPSDPIKVSYSKPFPGEPTGKDNPELLKLHPSHGHDMALINGISRIGWMTGGKSALWRDEDIADRITEKAVSFIKDNANRPFFLYFGTNDIHVPRAPHERFAGKTGMGARGDAILQFDYSVGEVIKVLEELKLLKNTIIILSSDNGPVIDDGYKDGAVELLGTHNPFGNFRGGKYSIFEAGTRVPMIVAWGNKLKKGSSSNALVSHIDLFASLAEIIGVEIPNGRAIDSRALSAKFKGKDKTDSEYIIEQSASGSLSIIMGGYKYITPNKGVPYHASVNIESGNSIEPQLYNLTNDIGERENIYSKYPEKGEELANKLKEIISIK